MLGDYWLNKKNIRVSETRESEVSCTGRSHQSSYYPTYHWLYKFALQLYNSLLYSSKIIIFMGKMQTKYDIHTWQLSYHLFFHLLCKIAWSLLLFTVCILFVLLGMIISTAVISYPS